MVISKCSPCDCIPGYISTDKYYQSSLTVWCDILSAITGGITVSADITPVKATVLPLKTIAFGSINAALTATGFVDGTKKLAQFFVTNDTDADLVFSVTAADDFLVRANSARGFEPSSGLEYFLCTTDLLIRYLNAPSRGNVYIEGWY